MKKLLTAISILLIVIAVCTHSEAALEGNAHMLTAQERLEAKKDLEKLSFSENKYFEYPILKVKLKQLLLVSKYI